MKILAILNYNIKSLIRNFKSEAIVFILPIVFMGIFGLAFGRDTSQRTYTLGVIQQEDPVFQSYVEELKDFKLNETSDKNLFSIEEFSSFDDANKKLKAGDIALFIEWKDNTVIVNGEVTSASFNQISSILSQFTAKFFNQTNDYFAVNPVDAKDSKIIPFHSMVPGLIVYGILIMLPSIAQRFTQITEKKYIFRYFTSKVTALDIILGSLMYYIILGLIQFLILLGTATLLGFRAEGNLVYGLIIAMLTSFFVVGTGLLIGSFIRKLETATNVGTIISIILGFFSEAFIVGISDILEFKVFGKVVQFNDLFPSKYASIAMRKVYLEGKGFDSIQSELLVLLITGLIILIVGIFVYNNKQLKNI